MVKNRRGQMVEVPEGTKSLAPLVVGGSTVATDGAPVTQSSTATPPAGSKSADKPKA
jgi:hypothetical protein